MHARHTDKQQYFTEQGVTTSKYVIPYLEAVMDITPETTVLEIGCGEGGNLMPFADLGCKEVIGVDLSVGKIEKAIECFKGHPHEDQVRFIAEDIYDSKTLGQYDLIIMRDTIEHIHDQERFMEYAKRYLKPDGKFFLGFPPWRNPFGGHQQMCSHKLLSKVPFFHLLPRPLYKMVLKAFGESDQKVIGLLEIYDTGISIGRFESILKKSNYRTDKKTHYFFNPNYEAKFGLKPRKVMGLISSIPWFKDFFTTAMYYVISKEESSVQPEKTVTQKTVEAVG